MIRKFLLYIIQVNLKDIVIDDFINVAECIKKVD